MKNKTAWTLILLGALTISPIAARGATETQTIRGYVLDSACAFTKNLKKPVSPSCAVACAKAGSPLVILTLGGQLYWPISAEIPATEQNSRLLPYAGQEVVVKGKVYAKGGSRAVVIESISAAAKGK